MNKYGHNFTDEIPQWSHNNFGLDNGLAPNMRQGMI